jgi:hypothetical protein
MLFFGIVFIATTTLVLVFKKEEKTSLEDSGEKNLSVKETYGLMWQICWLKPIKTMILILMTVKVT